MSYNFKTYCRIDHLVLNFSYALLRCNYLDYSVYFTKLVVLVNSIEKNKI